MTAATPDALPAADSTTTGSLNPGPRGRWPVRPGLVVVVISGLVIGWRRTEHPYADGDILWSIRAGTDFLRTGAIARTDPYSWTKHGASWVPNSWAWNVVLATAYKAGGFAGIAVLGILMSALIAGLAGTAARRAGASGTVAGLVFEVVGGGFSIAFYARPQMTDYAMVLALPLLVSRIFDPDRGRALRSGVAVVLVEIVWMNLHSTALLGPVLVLVAGAGHVLARPDGRTRAARRVIALTGLTALGCLATPYGTAPITHAEAVRAASVGLINEWLPVGFGDSAQVIGLVALALGAVALWFDWRARRYDMVGLLLVLGVATADAVRFAPMLALAAVPALAGACQRLPVRAFLYRRAWAVATVVIVLISLAYVGNFGERGVAVSSTSLVNQLPSGCRLLNDYGIGGAVILERPDVPVSIDSRNDLYGRPFELQSLHVLNDPAVGRAYLAQHDVTCVLVQSAEPLVHALSIDPGWRVVGHDSVRTLLVRAG